MFCDALVELEHVPGPIDLGVRGKKSGLIWFVNAVHCFRHVVHTERQIEVLHSFPNGAAMHECLEIGMTS